LIQRLLGPSDYFIHYQPLAKKLKMLKTIALSFTIAFLSQQLSAQDITRILFIGNSYTYVNDLPAILYSMAASTGDSLYYESNLPGGSSLQGHVSNSTSLAKIKKGNWDFVVLQDQSQKPSFPENLVEKNVYPYAKQLDSIINAHNSCAETIFYMTWGRKNGDASNCNFYPPLCTYEGMDSLLNLRYQTMATQNHALVSPVGQLWNYLRKNHPGLELYDADESHPSRIGSYAAACAFYVSVYHKDPENITYHFNLDPSVTSIIKSAAKTVVYDQYNSWRKFFPTKASFSIDTTQGNTVTFSNTSLSAKTYQWDFGDGSAVETSMSPSHTYAQPGTYTVQLIAGDCPYYDTSSKLVNIIATGINSIGGPHLKIYPNPAQREITLSINGMNTGIEQIEIFNAQGRRVLQLQLNATEFNEKLAIEDFQNGVYFVRVQTKNKAITSKFIVQQ